MEVRAGYQQTEIGSIPEDWGTWQIPSILKNGESSVKIGPFGSALKKDLLCNTGFKVYGQENVFNRNMSIGNRYINKEHFKKLIFCEIKPGDFLITMMRTIGKCMIVPDSIVPGIMDSHLIRLQLDDKKISSSLLYHFFQSQIIFNQIMQLSVGGIMDGLSSKIVKKLKIPLPSTITEQTAITNILSDMDEEITALETKLKKYEQIKQGMMQKLLTGQIRLSVPEATDTDNILPFTEMEKKPKHNEQFDGAVVIAVLASHFGSPSFVLSRFRYQKMAYLLHRHFDQRTGGYRKKAAGPYNPDYRFGGAEQIALKKDISNSTDRENIRVLSQQTISLKRRRISMNGIIRKSLSGWNSFTMPKTMILSSGLRWTTPW